MDRFRFGKAVFVCFVVLIAACGGGGSGRGKSQEPPPVPSPSNPPPTNPPSNPPGSAVSGLDARPSNTTCIAPERAKGTVTIGTQRVFPKLSFINSATGDTSIPILMLRAPRDSSRWFVVNKIGNVHVFPNDENVARSTVFLDIGARVEFSCGECGLLGMAFHPDFPTTPRVYVTYTSTQRTGRGPDTHLAEFTSRDGGLTLDPTSERIVIKISKAGTNHHGGHIAFGRDGYLYMSTGEGNSFQTDFAQRMNSLLGKMIRIDIKGSTGDALYRIPSNNPFAASTALCYQPGTRSLDQKCPEIYAWGFRNPWRWSFDRETGDIWLGDVGETSREEVNRVVRGGNYGWRCYEGTQRQTTLTCEEPVNPIPPVAEYDRTVGRSVTGGYVYRGTAIPALVGRYVFADFSNELLFDIPSDTQPTLRLTTGLDSGLGIASFAEDHNGDLYAVNIHGNLHRITAAVDAGQGGEGVATQLSKTGCVDPTDATRPASGLISYEPNAPFWSDGAAKQRWIGLPNAQKITVGADGDWDFPTGTVLVKNFHLNDRRIETRLFMRHPDGVWAGYSYEWNTQGTDATLVRGGKQVTIGGQPWIYPSESQCMQCHTQAAGRSLGPETKQLAININYPQTGRVGHQLVTLNTIDAMTTPIANAGAQTPYPNPAATSASLS
ncbi:MAG TPA: PQQ-dependent sugar dehydrogenase, partial [Steroidobacteraceae bacterium]|nr:PQQ-dependent sugar dehydrogenase [Steroidobacteraceae bacterium]